MSDVEKPEYASARIALRGDDETAMTIGTPPKLAELAAEVGRHDLVVQLAAMPQQSSVMVQGGKLHFLREDPKVV